MSNGLDQLCQRCGVLPEYHDIWGKAHGTSDAAKRAVLLAMGMAAGDDEQIAASLLTLDRRAWGQPLAPVQVDREGQAHRILVTLPESEQQLPYRWCLQRESGGQEQAEFTPGALEEAGRCHLDGRDLVRRILAVDLALEPGYHRFSLERADGSQPWAMSFIVAPMACFEPPALAGDGRLWGFAAQLYGLRSERNWGIGDFGDLCHMLDFCAEAGAGMVMLNPLHELFPDDPARTCPYSPSSRASFNTLYLEVPTIAEFARCAQAQAMVQDPVFQAQLRALRAANQVDYPGVAGLKAKVFECLYETFRSQELDVGTERARQFRAFQAEHGELLRGQALFDTLQEFFHQGASNIWGWPAWPEAYHDPHGAETAAFLEAHLARVEYFEYLQWQVDLQLAAAGAHSSQLGLGLGLILDLAVGVAEGGAATWTKRELFARGASAGAPPDELNLLGQDWGLPPWIPQELTAAAYRPFIELLRTQMTYSGALRMDHVMGLCRLFWVARGLPTAEGAYVAYPFADLLGLLALESQRNRCLVLGEDLGTVPEEVRQALLPAGVLSTRILSFERREDGQLKPPQAYPRQAVAAVGTHDLPTLTGFWLGLDIELRTRLHLFPDEETRNRQIITRAQDRVHLLLALEGEGLVPAGSGLHPADFPEMTADLAAQVYTYLARAPSKLLLVELEDGFGGQEQPNLPGTVDPVYPCWRLKQLLPLEAWPGSAYLAGIMAGLRRERPVPRPGPPEGGAGQALRSWLPRATYRLQMNSDFPLRNATALIPYLDALGISHAYLSPLLKARPGSRHGYDIIDHGSLNPEITSPEDFDQFDGALRGRGMGQIMDMVPNHMGIMGDDNAWWLDVLENGPASRFAATFDIDWHPITEGLSGRVLLPVLGDTYGAVLEHGDFRLAFDSDQGAFSVFYAEHRLPVDPREYPRILGLDLPRLEARLGAQAPALLEFQSLLTAFGHLPPRDEVSPEAMAERSRDKDLHKQHLATLAGASADLARFITEQVEAFNATGPGAKGVELMHGLLEAQAYRLAFWRVAADEINYRRFFDINNLAALNMDNPEVFERTHHLVRALLARGSLNGLRIDHPDGLSDPKAYFERLQAMGAELSPGGGSKPLYLVVEKILAAHEHLPESWAVHGTTGYDFAAACDGLFIDQGAEDRFTHIYHGFIRARHDLEDRVLANKHLIMETSLAGELQVLATRLTRLAKADRRTRDFTFNSLRSALAEVVAAFPVYRTYVTSAPASKEDNRCVDWAVGVARKRSQAADASIFDFIHDALLVQGTTDLSSPCREAVCAFAMKFQQYSAPVMAKAVEDTTFYQYNRLVSLNEVGSDPRRFGVSLAAFHQENQERARHWPHAMLASGTHDSKRSEDVRARISALSEQPEAWSRAIARWSRLNRNEGRKLGTARAPSPNDEYLLYQTLLGVWPFGTLEAGGLAELAQRVEAYLLKAGREAKVHSSWVNPKAEYEEGAGAFVRALLAPGPGNLFLRDFLPFQARLARVGACTSLAQQVLKLTAPGVPDLYQGTELWDFSLADPDNRRPVDYGVREAALGAIRAQEARGAAACARDLLDHLEDGRIKLYLIWKALTLRREQEALFRDGAYLPLKAHGLREAHVCAFARTLDGTGVLVVVPRLFGQLMGPEGHLPLGEAVWGDTWVELPPELGGGPWTNAFTDETIRTQAEGEGQGVRVADLFQTLPYAVLRPSA